MREQFDTEIRRDTRFAFAGKGNGLWNDSVPCHRPTLSYTALQTRAAGLVWHALET